MSKNYFTTENTHGYSDDDLDALNTAFGWLADENPEVEDYSISDALNNAWVAGAGAYHLYQSAGMTLGVVELTAHEIIALRRERDELVALAA